MIRKAALALVLAGATPAAATVAEDAAAAAANLAQVVETLSAAEEAEDRIAALTATIRAYEQGLAAMREALRQAAIREAALAMKFETGRDRLSRILGALSVIESQPEPLLFLHPAGPLGTARSGLILSDVTPALQAEAEVLARDLAELRDLRAAQAAAAKTLEQGLIRVQTARTELGQAVANRTDLPRRFTDDPANLQSLAEGAETLAAFADSLAASGGGAGGMELAAAKGKLPLPVVGAVIRRANEPDATGARRPGLTLATLPRALVTNPWPATIRYAGPLRNYGNVMILELGDGYLLVLSGLGTVYGEVGEVVPAGVPLGLMGGVEPEPAEFLVSAQDGGGARNSETLYMELRQGAEPVDADEWFLGADD